MSEEYDPFAEEVDFEEIVADEDEQQELECEEEVQPLHGTCASNSQAVGCKRPMVDSELEIKAGALSSCKKSRSSSKLPHMLPKTEHEKVISHNLNMS